MKEIKIGRQLVIDYYHCNEAAVSDINIIRELIHDIAKGIDVIILKELYQEFAPVGITGFAIVSESHISIHTWPEYSYMGIDIFSCKEIKLDIVLQALERRLHSASYDYRYIDRVSVV